MIWILKNLWLIPALPLLAAGLSALAKRPSRLLAASLAIGSMGVAFCLSCVAFAQTLRDPAARLTHNFDWFVLGETTLRLGWVLDPLTASMLVMITFVGTLIFVFSLGYMAHDGNFTRFFCFLALFAAAMLGLVIANSLLLLFMCWELVGLASYLLIGFWFHKPSAAAAAKKAFITTRIGDVIFFLGILWLYAETRTLLFYDDGKGCLEQSALANLIGQSTMVGMAVSTAIALLLFCGAIGKSGQFPLHVWLPDAMEGPTPVSALIHAATMVAAGVFLVARVYPLMEATPANGAVSTALQVVTWIGAITALFAALVAVAQTDIKRILAYSTVSQLGFMFMGLGMGGVAVGMFHLLTHAFFKALLFLGSGSVIHGCHEEQDIRRMGGLRKWMPVTFATYAIGMMALSGVPLFFSGFWSKDEILHAAWLWQPSEWKLPFLMGLCGAFLTAFYMTRQMWYVFFGESRAVSDAVHVSDESPLFSPSLSSIPNGGEGARRAGEEAAHDAGHPADVPHESPPIMTFPLAVLAVCAIGLSIFGTPVWPWFHSYLSGHVAHSSTSIEVGTLLVMALSSVVALGGIAVGWRLYSRRGPRSAAEPDPLEGLFPESFKVLRGKFFIDELYQISVLRWNAACAAACRWFDEFLMENMVRGVSWIVIGVSWISRTLDELVVNAGFDQGCRGLRRGAWLLALWQNGQVQRYLRVIGLALTIGALMFIWGCK